MSEGRVVCSVACKYSDISFFSVSAGNECLQEHETNKCCCPDLCSVQTTNGYLWQLSVCIDFFSYVLSLQLRILRLDYSCWVISSLLVIMDHLSYTCYYRCGIDTIKLDVLLLLLIGCKWKKKKIDIYFYKVIVN